MIDLDFEFESEVWLWQVEKGAWHFLTVPEDISEDIKAFTKHLARGFRSVKVGVRIGDTVWKTSIFPSKSHSGYILPIKASVRKAEGVFVNDKVIVKLNVPT